MSPTEVAMLVAGSGLALFALLRLRAALAVFRGAGQRRPRDVSHEQRAPSPGAAGLIAALVGLGFRRLGEVEMTLPDTSTLGALRRRTARHTAWVLLDGPETTMVEIVDVVAMFSLETRLADDSIIQTTYPLGEDIDVPGLRSTAVETTPAEAYDHHRRMVDARASSAIGPVEAHSMGDYLRRDGSYRERFATMFLRRAFIRGPLLSAALILIVAGGLIVLAVLPAVQ